MITSMISWAVFGLVVGLIARAIYPGPQKLGIFGTMILGIVGSMLGGYISYVFGFRPEAGAFAGGGWIMSIIGAMLVTWLGLRLGSGGGGAGGAAVS